MVERVQRVFVVTSQQRRRTHEKEEVIFLPFSKKTQRLYVDSSARKSHIVAFNHQIHRLHYEAWLQASAQTAKSLNQTHGLDLAIHASYGSLMLGTKLPTTIAPRVLIGTWTLPSPPAFRHYQPPAELMMEYCNRLAALVTVPRRRVDVIAAANRQSIEALSRLQSDVQWLLVSDPTFNIDPLPKHRRALFIDRSGIPRKGRSLLRTSLRRYGRSPLPLFIVSDSPDDWRDLDNVMAREYLPAEQFREELARSSFMISTSWREGGCTSVTQAASAQTLPIVFDIGGFEAIPDEAKLTIPTHGDLVANIYGALRLAADMNEQEVAERGEKAQQWAHWVNDSQRLASLVDSWLTAK